MRKFIEQSKAPRVEKAERFLSSLANGHDYKYFHGDGFPRHEDILNDAAATLEVFKKMREDAAAKLTKEMAMVLCESIDLNSEFFDETNEEWVLLKENNPELLEAYDDLFTLAHADQT